MVRLVTVAGDDGQVLLERGEVEIAIEYNGDIAQIIADETHAELVVLYSGALSDETGQTSTYIEYIRYNVTAIVEALGGAA